MEAVLRLDKVTRIYNEAHGKQVRVLEDASFSIGASEIVSLVAPSGAGKSTLLHLAGLLERPGSGEIYINGKATVKLADDQRTALRRNDIGFIYQFHHLLPEFSAAENLIIPQMLRGVAQGAAERRAHELLAFMGIEERATRADVYNSPGWKRMQANAQGRPVAQPRESRHQIIDLDAVSAFAEGDRVFHRKFGYGTVEGIEGDKLEVSFDKAGVKHLVASFVVAAESADDVPF